MNCNLQNRYLDQLKKLTYLDNLFSNTKELKNQNRRLNANRSKKTSKQERISCEKPHKSLYDRQDNETEDDSFDSINKVIHFFFTVLTRNKEANNKIAYSIIDEA